jgi:ribose 1,5-bisphosphokinase
VSARLIYLVGPSGSGKDSLLDYARSRLAGAPRVVFAHRYITRPAAAGGENHVALSQAEFAARLRAGLFALAWEGHGNAYGVGIEIEQWLARGATVVVNGSRAYLPEARRRFPVLLPVWIDVSARTLRERLLARGREDERAVALRLSRHGAKPDVSAGGIVIGNDGPLSEGGDALVALVRLHAAGVPVA